jgi:hypothetical protein
MALQKEIWISDVKETLERDFTSLSRMTDLSEFVEGKNINIPQAGTASTFNKNVTSFPLSVASRTDTVLQIPVDQYSTQAFHVSNLESAQLSYNKRDSIMGQHVRLMIQGIGDTVLQSILPTDNARLVTIAGAKLAYSDILKVAKMMDADNVPKANRSLELPTDMFYDLLEDDTVAKQYANGFAYSTVETGTVLKVAGINIFERPSVAVHSAAPAGVAYHKDSVGAAVGNIDFMTDFGDNGLGNPLYLGGIMSAIVWLGAGKLRTDNKGIVGLVR